MPVFKPVPGTNTFRAEVEEKYLAFCIQQKLPNGITVNISKLLFKNSKNKKARRRFVGK